MSTLHVIRHGKASPESKVYDQLHTIGQAQARKLGEHYAARGMRFDALYTGPLQRQRQTLRLMREAAGAAASAWPEEIVIDGLAEAQIEKLVRHCLTSALPHDAELQAIVQAAGDGKDAMKMRVMVEQVLMRTIHLWVDEKIEMEDVESARAFRARVDGAFEQIKKDAGRGRHIAVVTSNGVIGYLLATLAGNTDPMRTGFVTRIWNSSVTQLAVADTGLSVLAQNAIDHLLDPDMHTLL
jgi:broad specificity phosphatase PhoE